MMQAMVAFATTALETLMRELKLIFLDIDGVLNRAKPMGNGYCGIDETNRLRFNTMLNVCTDAKLVITSSWRNQIYHAHGTLNSLEECLLTHGLNVRDRVIGVLDRDPDDDLDNEHWSVRSPEWWLHQARKHRKQLLINYLHPIRDNVFSYVIIDDVCLNMRRQILCDPEWGLTWADTMEVCRLLHQAVNPEFLKKDALEASYHYNQRSLP